MDRGRSKASFGSRSLRTAGSDRSRIISTVRGSSPLDLSSCATLTPEITADAPVSLAGLTTNQRRGFLAAWGGVVLDGVDSFIYALVLVPALRALLPASGI